MLKLLAYYFEVIKSIATIKLLIQLINSDYSSHESMSRIHSPFLDTNIFGDCMQQKTSLNNGTARRSFHENVVCDEMRLSVEFVTVGFLGICRQYWCD